MLMHNNLFTQFNELKARIEANKIEFEKVKAQIKERALPLAKEILFDQGKDFGTVTVPLNEGEVKVTVAKKVEWDNERLMEIAEQLPTDLAKHVITWDVKIKENTFKDLDEQYKDLTRPARTVKEGQVTIELVEEN